MSKITLTGFALLSVLFFANASGNNASQSKQNASEALTGTLQKMIVENASVTMQLDLNGLNGSNSLVARPVTLHFAAAPNSFFPVLVFNDLLRGLQPGSMALALQNSSSAGVNAPGYSNLPAALSSSLKRLTVEKLPSGQGFDLAVRDSNTGFTFFNIEGHQYNYDAACSVVYHHRRQASHIKTVCQHTGYSIRGWLIGRNNFNRRGDATDPDRPACQGRTQIDGHAAHATCSRSRSAKSCARPGCYRRRCSRTWRNMEVTWNSVGLAIGTTLVTTATSQSIGLHCRKPITRSFRRISIG